MAINKAKFTKKLKEKYSFKDETFFHVAKNNPKDKVEVEVGDSKQPDFKPQVKVQRWDNEVNLSFRLKDDGVEEEIVETKGEEIVWKKGKREAHFYDIQNEEHPDGAYEFEVVLLEKPATNVVEFSLNTKGLDFFYQPALTPQEIAEGADRPENVIGSYAVYHSTKGGMNDANGMEYKVGKVGHIYRPQVEDANGVKVWGELNVDTVSGVLSVTIPQEFLDNAVYPVRHAAGLTFGYTTLGATTTGFNIADWTSDTSTMRGHAYNLPSAGTLDSISAGLNSGTLDNRTMDLFLALYREDSAGADSHDLVVGLESLDYTIDGTQAKFYTLNASSESLTADDYIIAALGNGEDFVANMRVAICYDAGGSTKRSYLESTTGAGSYATRKAENPWTEVDANTTNVISIYATYTASGGGTVVKDLISMGIIAFPR